MKYVGIVEKNSWERETFGYYFEYSKETEAALTAFVQKYLDEGDNCYRVEVCSGEELQTLLKHDSNTYRCRVSLFKTPEDWNTIHDLSKPIAVPDADPFYKGRGLEHLYLESEPIE